MVVIIGATGFIGMYTVEKFLKEGKEVFAFIKYCLSDICLPPK